MNQAEHLLDIIGPEAMAKLCEACGGTTLYIPKKVPHPERNHNIRVKFEQSLNAGSSTLNAYQLLANDFGLSMRRVQEIVAE
tara:strand:+ start:645 stop:890 length:246 start_codon:yes stop_codon:yes gene_type:complete